ncbi:MAG: hypothetical protein RR365_10795 [Bacteroides sp.]
MEIERKFLLDGFPEDLSLIKEVHCTQGYISIVPEVRIRSYECGGTEDYKLTVKGEGSISREEVETHIAKSCFDALARLIDAPLIEKNYKMYDLGDGMIFEASLVDSGSETEFYYGEVEFESEREALNFSPLKCMGKEVTYDDSYKMKNYWKRTRGVG